MVLSEFLQPPEQKKTGSAPEVKGYFHSQDSPAARSIAPGITLAAGFEVAASAEFLAKIEPAGPPTGVAREYAGGIEYYNGTLEAIPRPPKEDTTTTAD